MVANLRAAIVGATKPGRWASSTPSRLVAFSTWSATANPSGEEELCATSTRSKPDCSCVTARWYRYSGWTAGPVSAMVSDRSAVRAMPMNSTGTGPLLILYSAERSVPHARTDIGSRTAWMTGPASINCRLYRSVKSYSRLRPCPVGGPPRGGWPQGGGAGGRNNSLTSKYPLERHYRDVAVRPGNPTAGRLRRGRGRPGSARRGWIESPNVYLTNRFYLN